MIHVRHVTNPTKSFRVETLERAIAAIGQRGGYVTTLHRDGALRVNAVTYSDFPQHDPHTRPIEIDPLTPDILGSSRR